MLDSFLRRKDIFAKTNDNTNECDFLIFSTDMCQHLEYLYNWVNKVFQNHAWVKDHFKVQGGLLDFKVIEYRDLISDSTLQLTFLRNYLCQSVYSRQVVYIKYVQLLYVNIS